MPSVRQGTFRRPARLEVELLESRVVPYALTGTAWPRPELISLGIVPDGTNLGGISSSLVATLNSRFGSQSAWQHQILKAAQVWAQQTNLNFVLTTDSGVPIGSEGYLQGSPSQADIRIGGFNFGRSTLAQAYLPPPVNNFSLAGDTQFNTGQPWVLGTTGGYDLFTVAMHEIGHALGLGHSTSYNSAVYPTYTGIRAGLGADDISGIRALYSFGQARTHDLVDVILPNNSLWAASYLDLLLGPASGGAALVTDLDITTKTDLDYFTFAAPATTAGSLTVTVQSEGLSLLMPSVGLYNDRFQLVGFATGLGQYGSTLTMTVSGVNPGERFYLCIMGADNSAFSIGRYALTVNFGSGPSPAVPLPDTLTLDDGPLVSGGALAQEDEHDHDHDHDHQGPATDVVIVDRTKTPVAAVRRPGSAADGNLTPALARAGASAAIDGEASLRASRPVFSDPVFGPRLVLPFQSRYEGGANEEAEATIPVENERIPPAADEATSLRPAPQPAVEMTPEQVREAGDRCFIGIAWDFAFVDEPVDLLVAAGDETDGGSLPVDPLAAAACLAVVFGGHWAYPREQGQRRRGPLRE